MLCAATDEERKEWIKALTYHIYSGRGGGNFVQTNLNVTCLHKMSWKSPVCNLSLLQNGLGKTRRDFEICYGFAN